MTSKVKTNNKNKLRRVCVAPMIDCTDQYFRQLIRLISSKVYLYTEMITSQAILKSDDMPRLLAYNAVEHPVALQVGGAEPSELVKVAKLAEDFGYDEINLNVGCPSPRVQAGRFGACLMKEPETVARCVEAMQAACNIPVTVKTRIGVDAQESYEAFYQFIDTVQKAGCEVFIIHARKAILKGLSPKQNRTIPPLKYEFAHQIKRDFPNLEIIVNGGIKDLDVNNEFFDLDGIMVGREAYSNPFHLIDVDQRFYEQPKNEKTRNDILKGFTPYAEQAIKNGVSISILLKHLYGLSHGISGGSLWRRKCAELIQSTSKNNYRYSDFLEHFPKD